MFSFLWSPEYFIDAYTSIKLNFILEFIAEKNVNIFIID